MTAAETKLAEALVEVKSPQTRNLLAFQYLTACKLERIMRGGTIARKALEMALEALGATPDLLAAVREEQEQ